MSYSRFASALLLGASFVCAPASAQTFGTYGNFPPPAATSFNVIGTALDDGRLLLWNGDAIYLQVFAGGDSFSPIASGYAGDPGFLIPFPSGNAFLLGEGFGGRIYRFDLNDPVDYEAGSELAVVSHFAAAFLTEDLVLLDVGAFDPDTFETSSQLVSLDLSGAKSTLTPVVTKGPDYFTSEAKDVDKPMGAFSSSVYTDTVNGFVYAMDGNTTELRRFSLAALISAHNSATDLDWATDGALVGNPGDFLGGGVVAIDVNGNLVVPGFGGVQFVDPALADPSLAAVVDTLAPAGAFEFYSVIYNPYFDTIITRIFSGLVQTQENGLVDLSALSLLGLGALAAALTSVGLNRYKRNCPPLKGTVPRDY